MLDLERFRLLKAMEDKNTPKKEDKIFRDFGKKKFCQKTPAKKKLRLWMEEKGPKNRMFMKVIFAKGLK